MGQNARVGEVLESLDLRVRLVLVERPVGHFRFDGRQMVFDLGPHLRWDLRERVDLSGRERRR